MSFQIFPVRCGRSVLHGKAALFLATLLCFLSFSSLPVSGSEDFFSHERFFLDQGLLERIPADGRVRTQIRQFGNHYTEGLYELSSGRLERAELHFRRARRVWPEFYATDLLLALTLEAQGDHSRAARYYKSYLNKLHSLESGSYRISGPVMVALMEGRIEEHEHAQKLVEERIARYGMDLDAVRPAGNLYFVLRSGLIFVVMVFLVFLAVYGIFPYLRKVVKMRNVPEGFWICPVCTTTNPDPRYECERCGYRKGHDGD